MKSSIRPGGAVFQVNLLAKNKRFIYALCVKQLFKFVMCGLLEGCYKVPVPLNNQNYATSPCSGRKGSISAPKVHQRLLRTPYSCQ